MKIESLACFRYDKKILDPGTIIDGIDKDLGQRLVDKGFARLSKDDAKRPSVSFKKAEKPKPSRTSKNKGKTPEKPEADPNPDDKGDNAE